MMYRGGGTETSKRFHREELRASGGGWAVLTVCLG